MTIESTLIIGLLNAYSYASASQVYISPQTGNLISIGFHISQGKWVGIWVNLTIFLGFSAGCFLAAGLQSKKWQERKRLTMNIVIQGIVLFSCILIDLYGLSQLDLLLLSGISGLCLSSYRQIGSTKSVNNSIMTGNLRNLYACLYSVLFNKEKSRRQELKNFLNYCVIVGSFFNGVLLGFYATAILSRLPLYISIGISIVEFVQIRQSKEIN